MSNPLESKASAFIFVFLCSFPISKKSRLVSTPYGMGVPELLSSKSSSLSLSCYISSRTGIGSLDILFLDFSFLGYSVIKKLDLMFLSEIVIMPPNRTNCFV